MTHCPVRQSGCSCHIPASSVQDLASPHQHWMWLLAFIVVSDTRVMMSPCSCNWHSPGLTMSTFHVCLYPCPQWNGRSCLASCLIVMFGFFTPLSFEGFCVFKFKVFVRYVIHTCFLPSLYFHSIWVSLLWVTCLVSQNPTSSPRSQRIRLVFSFS